MAKKTARRAARRKRPRPKKASTEAARPTEVESPEGGRVAISVKVNGTAYDRRVEPRTLLVEFLREDLRLTGTHIGCDTTHCGACTVLVDGHAIKSCTMLAVQTDGTSVTTIEGLAKDGRLDPLQQAFKDHHGLQCGFCTPGVVLAAKELLELNPHPSEEEIREGISGNLCRCTGYVSIVRAVTAAAQGARAA
jgi:aerobic carbon-monoxide dehydrogenase small subunit